MKILAPKIDELWSQTMEIETVYSNSVSLKSIQSIFKILATGKTIILNSLKPEKRADSF